MKSKLVTVLIFKNPEQKAERYSLLESPSNLDLIESLRQDAEQAHYRMEVRQGRRRVIYYYDFDQPKQCSIDDIQTADL